MKPNYYLLLVVYLLTLAIRDACEVLIKNQRINPKNTGLFLFILLIMCLMWISWFSLCPLDPYHLDVPELARYAGLGIFILGLILAIGALIQLKGVENIDHLVTTGLFARFRHPMYTGFIFWILGWVIFHGAPVSLIAGLVGIGNILYWRHLEENHLREQFGRRYLDYSRQTWF